MTSDNPYDFLGGAPEESVSSVIGILVYVECENDQVVEESLVAVGKARELADMVGTGVGAILLNSSNEDCAQIVIHAGANKIFLREEKASKTYDPDLYCQQLIELVNQVQPEIVLAATTQTTIDFFPKVAQNQQTGLVSGCIALEVDTMERVLLATRPAYGGKMNEVHVCETARPQMILLMPATFPVPISDDFRTGEIEKI